LDTDDTEDTDFFIGWKKIGKSSHRPSAQIVITTGRGLDDWEARTQGRGGGADAKTG